MGTKSDRRRDKRRRKAKKKGRPRGPSYEELHPEARTVVDAFELLADQGVWIMNVVRDQDYLSLCAIDWDRLRRGELVKIGYKPEDEAQLREAVAKAWADVEPYEDVRILGAQGREDYLDRVLAMDGNLGNDFESYRDRLH